jgi:gamma-glutamyltranspeptidase / glutathione hydrolase
MSSLGRRPVFLVPVLLAVIALLVGARRVLTAPERARATPSPYRNHFAIATEHPMATRVGLEALRSGANAVDTAISVAFVLGVVQPASSGIGGGGFAMVWDAGQRKTTVLDFRETAPAAVDVAGLDERPRIVDGKGRGRSIGVPGEVAGLAELHRRFGRRPFADDVAPAIALAEGGYYVGPHLARLALAAHSEINWSAPLHALLKPAGWAVGTGTRVVNRALGSTLRRIAAEGKKGLCEGPVAREIVQAAGLVGGRLSEADLAGYAVVERDPLAIDWEGMTVLTMPPPSAGGLLLAETLGMFGKADLDALRLGTGPYVHVLAEAFRGAMADRMRTIGDPAFVKADIAGLVDKARLRDRRAAIALEGTRPSPRFFMEEHGTTHLVIVDAQGSVVSLTLTINGAFGSMVSTETTGVVLNNELDDFTTKASDDLFSGARGFVGNGPNRPRPFARPVSSMTPTIAFKDGLPVLALGGSGGLRIPTGVTEAFLAHAVFGHSVRQCVAMRRFHTPPDYEPPAGPLLELDYGATRELQADLWARGEIIRLEPNYTGVQMVAIDRGPGGAVVLSAAADPRKAGSAAAE